MFLASQINCHRGQQWRPREKSISPQMGDGAVSLWM
jgi:hypothetical protein